MSKLRRLQQAPAANGTAPYNQDLTQQGKSQVLTGACVALRAGLPCRGDACQALVGEA